MRRSEKLVELSRRDFCGLACAGIALVGCTPGTGAIQTGGLDPGGGDTTLPDSNDTPPPMEDGGTTPPHDAGTTAHDGGTTPTPDAGTTGVACTTTMIDVGAASSFTTNTPVYVSSAKCFIVRDAGGLFAVSARCTHAGVTVGISGSKYLCPAHGAQFQFNGAIISGPVSSPLSHYAMCNTTNGHVAVETSMVVSSTQRLNA